MGQKKWYAVKQGHKTGVFTHWEQARAAVSGYSGAEYKSFPSHQAAEAYLTDAKPQRPPQTALPSQGETPEAGVVWAFIDGSYDQKKERYGYGGVMIYADHIETFFGGGSDPALTAMRNVSGEMSAAMRAVQKAYQKGLQQVTLYYDYTGIEQWATGQWQRKNPYTEQYHEYMQRMATKIQVRYVKVPAHAGVYYNEIADQLAKQGVSQSK